MAGRKRPMAKRPMGRTNRRRTFITPYSKGLPGIPPASVFTTKLKAFVSSWEFGTATTFDFWRYLSLTPANLGNTYQQHAACFDEFKIWGITFELRPNYDNIDGTTPAAGGYNQLGTFHYCIDPASNTGPSGSYNSNTLNSFLEQSQNIVSSKCDAPKKIYFKPKVASQVYGGGLSGKANFCPWLKCNVSQQETFTGVHCFIQAPGMVNSNFKVRYDIFATAHISFRGNA